jgi:hypothetical protein
MEVIRHTTHAVIFLWALGSGVVAGPGARYAEAGSVGASSDAGTGSDAGLSSGTGRNSRAHNAVQARSWATALTAAASRRGVLALPRVVCVTGSGPGMGRWSVRRGLRERGTNPRRHFRRQRPTTTE